MNDFLMNNQNAVAIILIVGMAIGVTLILIVLSALNRFMEKRR